MNSERFLNAFGEIKSKYISEATKEKKNNAAAKRILLIAAVSCAAILIGLSPLLNVILKKSGNTGITADTVSTEDTGEESVAMTEKGTDDVSGQTFFSDEKLVINVDGKQLTFEKYQSGSGSLTPKTILCSFETQTEIEGIIWDVYLTEEYPDLSYVLVISGTNASWIYKAAIEDIQNENVVVLFPEELPEELEEKMEDGAGGIWGFYWFAKINDKYFALCEHDMAWEREVTLNGYSFKFRNFITLFCIYDAKTGEMKSGGYFPELNISEEETRIIHDEITLETIYEGIDRLRQKRIEKNDEIKSFDGTIPDNPSNELIERINNDFIITFNNNERNWKGEYIGCESFITSYYGEYDGAVVFRTDDMLGLCVVVPHYVAGYEFTEGSSLTFTVWKDGKFYNTLEEAYKDGILTIDNVKNVLWLRYTKKQIDVKYTPKEKAAEPIPDFVVIPSDALPEGLTEKLKKLNNCDEIIVWITDNEGRIIGRNNIGNIYVYLTEKDIFGYANGYLSIKNENREIIGSTKKFWTDDEMDAMYKIFKKYLPD